MGLRSVCGLYKALLTTLCSSRCGSFCIEPTPMTQHRKAIERSTWNWECSGFCTACIYNRQTWAKAQYQRKHSSGFKSLKHTRIHETRLLNIPLTPNSHLVPLGWYEQVMLSQCLKNFYTPQFRHLSGTCENIDILNLCILLDAFNQKWQQYQVLCKC